MSSIQFDNQLSNGLATAFIDREVSCNLAYKPQFISNDYKRGKKVLSSIENELLHCSDFCISVAFITLGGVEPLLSTLKILENKGVSGKILTTNYLNFSEPKALSKLAGLSNIELKMYDVNIGDADFHTKGYIFRNDDAYRIIVGSSNMTHKALTVNKEWNTKVVSTEQGEYAYEIVNEFNELWNSDAALAYKDIINQYSTLYDLVKKQREISAKEEVISLEAYRLTPNRMQIGFIENLKSIIDRGENKALLISATGTGKTYASAFALREYDPGKAIFIVHREQIAKQAMDSFRRVFGGTKKFGLLSGSHKDFDADYIFATMQTMAKEGIMAQFDRNHFDVIVIDEAHRTGAGSYQKIMDYFEPEFWLGMTATPERTDAFDVYAAYDHNIACEIRLQQALEENLLCPFHYFGITDLEIDGETVDDRTGFNKLASDMRVDYIIEQIEYYGYSGDRVKGLMFCSSVEESTLLSEKLNDKGYATKPLSGKNGQEEREDTIDRLINDDRKDRLDYILTVDIFNEGVDIPEINQVVLLRPTESPIVFVQQLGRGLRQNQEKEFVVIIDFIGNYSNNFMIPIALSGDRTYNKDNIRRYVSEGERVIPGSSTVHFDEISKKRIYSAIDSANFSDLKLIKENYKNLKHKLGRIPRLDDFEKYGEMDVQRIFDNKSIRSYYRFLNKYEPDYKITLGSKEEKVVEFISSKIANGKRIHELEFFKILFHNKSGLMGKLQDSLSQRDIQVMDVCRDNIINIMTNEFTTGSGKKTYEECIFIEKDDIGNEYHVHPEFLKMLADDDFVKILKELVEYGIGKYEREYSNGYSNTDFVLYQKYTYDDVCRLLNWKKGEVALNIGGYKYDSRTKTFPVFINYDKSENIQETIKYRDRFVNDDTLIAISKSGRTKKSEDVQNFINAEDRGIQVDLFVRKNKDDKCSKEFYYLGHMKSTGRSKEFVMENTDKTAVEIEWKLDTPVREDLFEYIVNDIG